MIKFSRAAPLLLLCIAGCGSSYSGPETVEVTGEIKFSDGQPFPGGSIEFRSTENTSVTTMGSVKADGTFSLRTIGADGAAEGAVPGIYEQAILTPLLAGDQTDPMGDVYPNAMATRTLTGPYEIDGSKANHLKITVER